MILESATDIIANLPATVQAGLSSGNLLFFPSTTHHHTEDGVDFEIRVCPALQKKPSSVKAQLDPAGHRERPDPFKAPYVPGLYVGDLASSFGQHVVLLNKYSVVQSHFILATKEYEPQLSPLSPADLVHAYTLLLAGRNSGQNFFAFFNCGEHSGASQAHKHVQFLPIDPPGPPIERLAKMQQVEDSTKPFTMQSLPYAHFTLRLPPVLAARIIAEDLADTLCDAYITLLDLVISTARRQPVELQAPGPPSYNVILTLEHLHLIPRCRETYTLPQTGDQLSINALGFAGLLLVKSDHELDALRKEMVKSILKDVAMEQVTIPSAAMNDNDL